MYLELTFDRLNVSCAVCFGAAIRGLIGPEGIVIGFNYMYFTWDFFSVDILKIYVDMSFSLGYRDMATIATNDDPSSVD